MSFDTEVVKDGRGRFIRVDISIDNFSTISYRYGSVAGLLDGTNMYSARVLELAPIRRALGTNHIASSSTSTIVFDNADASLDWLNGTDSFQNVVKARLRIYVCLFDPSTPTSIVSKQLGEFVISSWPTSDNSRITVPLADDMLGRLGGGLLLPTLLDWQGVGNTSNNPVKNSIGLPASISVNTPMQLAFGEDWVLGFPHIIPWGNNDSGDAYYEKIVVPLYATTDTTAVDQDLVQQLRVEMYSTETEEPTLVLLDIAREFYPPDWIANGVTQQYTWEVEKSPTITKGGIDFQIVYLVVREDLGFGKYQNVNLSLPVSDAQQEAERLATLARLRTFAYANGYPTGAVDSTRQYPFVTSRVMKWYVKGVPLSQITNPATLLNVAHACDVITDLVSEYGTGTMDSTSAQRVKDQNPWAACAGVVQPWTERANDLSRPPPPLSMRQALTRLAQSSDLDVFVNWSGNIALSTDFRDFTAQTSLASLTEFKDSDFESITLAVPSTGERHAPYNRVYFSGGKPLDAERLETPFQGPFDLSVDAVPNTRIIDLGLEQGWRPYRQQALDPLQWRQLDTTVRPRVRFRTNIAGLRLELGDLFRVKWVRGTLNAPYSTATAFQCESITYAAGDDSVEIEAIYMGDLDDERQYLLDDETLLVRSKGALTGDCVPVGDAVVDFGGTINLTTMGVEIGDILVLRDSTQAADVFTRNGTWRITDVTDTNTVEVAVNGAAAYPTAGTIANADWSIVRGATTYPTAVSDPTNYPSGGDMYGKVTDAGTYSDSSVGNQLLTG